MIDCRQPWATSSAADRFQIRFDRVTRFHDQPGSGWVDAEGEWDETSASLAERTRRYHQALMSYEPAMLPYDGDALLVRALDQLRQLPGCAADYGWRRHVRGALEIYDLPGNHLGILTRPHVRELARWMAGKLSHCARRKAEYDSSVRDDRSLRGAAM